MTIIATCQTYNENEPSGDPWEKEFEDEDAMYKWLKDQSGHPWLSIRHLSHREKEELEDS